MKFPKSIVLYLLYLVGTCSATAQESEYQSFVAEIKKEKFVGPPASEMELKELETESGLSLFAQGINAKYGALKLSDLELANQFYEDKIKTEYKSHRYLDYLKAKFIYITVNTFELTTSTDIEFKKYLIKYTSDLIQCRKGIDFQLYFKLKLECLEALKGFISSDGYQAMVKSTKFSLRFHTEMIEGLIAELTTDKSDRAKRELQHLEVMLASLKVFSQKIESLMN